MNKILKAKIIEIFGTQADFAMALDEDETLISRVIRQRREIDDDKKLKWADALSCKPKDVFPDEDENSN